MMLLINGRRAERRAALDDAGEQFNHFTRSITTLTTVSGPPSRLFLAHPYLYFCHFTVVEISNRTLNSVIAFYCIQADASIESILHPHSGQISRHTAGGKRFPLRQLHPTALHIGAYIVCNLFFVRW
jgi:hypothetical protein